MKNLTSFSKRSAQDIFLEYVNDWLTVAAMAENYNRKESVLKKLIAKGKKEYEKGLNRKFPNGFESWMETHHEVVSYITKSVDVLGSLAHQRSEEQGTGGLYELAEELTDEFELLNKDRQWDGEFFDEIESFLTKKGA